MRLVQLEEAGGEKELARNRLVEQQRLGKVATASEDAADRSVSSLDH